MAADEHSIAGPYTELLRLARLLLTVQRRATAKGVQAHVEKMRDEHIRARRLLVKLCSEVGVSGRFL